MIRAGVVALAVALGLSVSNQASAQTVAPLLNAGDSVRVRLPGALRVHASVVATGGEMLNLRTAGIEADWPISVFELSSLDVHRDRTPREGFRHGAALGLAGGLFVGAAAGLLLHVTGVVASDTGGPSEQMLRATFRFTGIGAVGGALFGGFLGGARPGRGWVSIPLPAGGARGR